MSSPDQQTTIFIEGPLVPSFRQTVGKILMFINAHVFQGRFIPATASSRFIMEPGNELAMSIKASFDQHNPSIHGMNTHGMSTDTILHSLFDSDVLPMMTLSGMGSLIFHDSMRHHQARVPLLISRLNFTFLWLRKRLFYSYCITCSQTRYSNKYYDSDESFCHPEMAMFGARVNPHLIGEIADETCGLSCSPDLSVTDITVGHGHQPLSNERSRTIPLKYPLLITSRAFTGLVGCHPMSLANDLMYNMEEDEARTKLKDLENDLEWTRIEASLGWFSVKTPHLKKELSRTSVSQSDQGRMPISERTKDGQLVLLDAKLLLK